MGTNWEKRRAEWIVSGALVKSEVEWIVDMALKERGELPFTREAPCICAIGGTANLKIKKPGQGGRPRHAGCSLDVSRARYVERLDEEASRRGKVLCDEEWVSFLKNGKWKPGLFPQSATNEALRISISKGRKELGISSRTGRAKTR